MSAHTYILEDWPELPKSSGPHAEEGAEILEGMYPQGWTSPNESNIQGGSGRAGGQVSALGVWSDPAGIVSKNPRTVPA
jgi:hypothetical protein